MAKEPQGSRHLNYKCICQHTLLFYVTTGIELSSSSLYGKHFTNWLSPQSSSKLSLKENANKTEPKLVKTINTKEAQKATAPEEFSCPQTRSYVAYANLAEDDPELRTFYTHLPTAKIKESQIFLRIHFLRGGETPGALRYF